MYLLDTCVFSELIKKKAILISYKMDFRTQRTALFRKRFNVR